MRTFWLLMLLSAAAVAPACAEERMTHDDLVRIIYNGMADSVRDQYDSALLNVPKFNSGESAAKVRGLRQSLKILFYNKAALFAFCAADAEEGRPPDTPRVPARENPALTKCVEQSFAALSDFTNKLNYAGVFFPERIVRCGEESRLPDRERLLRPYEFLGLDKPRLYDFSRYNECLMQSD
jgi:hypothetical protein